MAKVPEKYRTSSSALVVTASYVGVLAAFELSPPIIEAHG